METNDPTALSISDEGVCRAGNKLGKYYIVISLNKNKYPTSTVIIKTVIR